MKTALTWILLILLAVGGIVGSYVLSEKFRADARETWEVEASQTARWLSGTVLGWLEESYAPLSGLAILFENSREVTEVEFLGATDALEARATAFFLDAKAVARPRERDGAEWSIEFSNDPQGPLSRDIPLSKQPEILDTIKVAVDNPDQIILGPTFSGEEDSRFSPVALAIQDVHGPLVVLGLVNFDAMVKGLFDIYKLDGLQLQIQGRFKEPAGPGDLRKVIGESMPNALYSVSTRTVSAGADLSITWYVLREFSKGPKEALANFTLMGGFGITLLLVSFIGLLLQRNRTITKKVEVATDELAESHQRLDLALVSSGIGTWDWNIDTDTLSWDEAQHRIMGTYNTAEKLDWANFTKLIHPEDRQRFESEINATLVGDEDYVSEYRFVRPDGDVCTIETRGHVIRDAGGRPLRMIGTSMNITERKQAEEELKKLSQAVEQSSVSVVITNLNGTIEYVNPKFCEVTGYTVAEAIGQNPRILKSEHTPPEVYRELWQAIKTGNEWRGEFQNKKKNGEIYWEAATISPLKSGDDAIAYLAVKEDITERKQMEDSIREKEARFRGYFENSQVGLAVTLPTQEWVEANDQLQKMFGYSIDELRKLTWAELTHPDDLEADVKQFERMLAGEIDNYTLDKRFIRKDGEVIHTNLSVACMRNEAGDVVNILASFQDITERKKMDADLHARIQELDEAQSAMLNMMEDLDEEKARAEDATRAKSDFLANMSHEIRTPMNAVIGMVYLALKTELTPKQQDYLNKIQSSANSLLGIINDILDFSKIEAGKLDMEAVEFDLAETLDNVANVITVKAQEKENLEVLFYLDPQVPNFLVGDPLRLNQILVNLGNNAIKFTEKGEIVLTTKIMERSDDNLTLQFSIRDTGIGMTQEQKAKLFQAFSQADTSITRKYGGTGLGLTISKRLVDMMGGEIGVESEPGQGTTFSFTAVFGPGKGKVNRRFDPSPDLRGLKVLVVDDNATSREILQEILESFSFEVSLAASGKDALEDIEKADKDTPFELVIMDWNMPGMNGLETSTCIKTNRKLSKIPPIILVTAYGREEIMQEADQIGLEGFLLKPVNSSVLFDTAMHALGKDSRMVSRENRKSDKSPQDLKAIEGARILLVEDNEINQQVAGEILEGSGFVVTIANNGLEAVEQVQSSQFDAVLMDIQMPVMDGHTASREIRNLKSEIRKIPIIAMTAHAMAGDEEKSKQAGMNGHITKPIDPDQLFANLQKWIKPDGERAVVGKPPINPASPELEQKATDEVELPESLPGFDLTDGLKRLQGNKKLYRKLLLNFGADYRDDANDIREALAGKDYERVHSVVHNLKGVAGNLAATDLQTAGMNFEKLVKGIDPKNVLHDKLNLSLAKLETALNQTLESVQQLGGSAAENIEKSSEISIGAIPPDVVDGIVDRIRDAAEMGDVTQIKSIAEEMISGSDVAAPICDKLIQLADDFDFDGVQNFLSELVGEKSINL